MAKHPGGRPKAKYDAAIVEKLGGVLATNEDMAGWFDVCERTVERWRASDKKFIKAYTKGASKARVSLRQKQVTLALEGNPTMLVWLGKSVLGQSERLISEVSGKDGAPIEISDAKRELQRKLAGIVATRSAQGSDKQP